VIIDTSALVAVFLREKETEQCLELLADADELGISSATVLEAGIGGLALR
jgi:uncharacterized protein with PIN domain